MFVPNLMLCELGHHARTARQGGGADHVALVSSKGKFETPQLWVSWIPILLWLLLCLAFLHPQCLFLLFPPASRNCRCPPLSLIQGNDAAAPTRSISRSLVSNLWDLEGMGGVNICINDLGAGVFSKCSSLNSFLT